MNAELGLVLLRTGLWHFSKLLNLSWWPLFHKCRSQNNRQREMRQLWETILEHLHLYLRQICVIRETSVIQGVKSYLSYAKEVYKTTISEAEQMSQTRRLVCIGTILLALAKKRKHTGFILSILSSICHELYWINSTWRDFQLPRNNQSTPSNID